jgi:molybdopterin-guanine dinucleotide biosynthesis protein A
MNAKANVAGLLLAGGKSSRMGGGDKCLRQLAGKPILACIIERLRPQVSDILINANGDPSRFAAYGFPVVADSIAGYAGPLAGVHAGLEWFRANRPSITRVVTIATDTPFFPFDLVDRFRAEAGDEPTLAVARSDEGVHPVIGLWPVALAPALEAFLKREQRKVGQFAQEQAAVEVYFPKVELGGTAIDPFYNINAPEDLARANAIMMGQVR